MNAGQFHRPPPAAANRPVAGVTSRPAARLTVRQVRRAAALAGRCADRGDDPASWAGRLLSELPGVVGGADWAVAFPDAGVLLTAGTDGGPAEPVCPRSAAAATAAAREAERVRAAAGRPVAAWGTPPGPLAWAWRDRAGRGAVLLCRRPGRAAGNDESAGSFGDCGPRAAGARFRSLSAFLARRLRASSRRLTFPGEPAPGDLPPKTREVLYRLLRGETERQIADAAGVTTGAVHKHVHRIHKHFGVGSRGRLLARWVAQGWGRRCDWRPPAALAFADAPAAARPPPQAAGKGGPPPGQSATAEASAASVQ